MEIKFHNKEDQTQFPHFFLFLFVAGEKQSESFASMLFL